MRCARAGLVLALVVAAGVGRVRAQGLDGERFAPAAGGAGGLAVERPLVRGGVGFGGGLFLHFADDPLVLRDGATGTTDRVLLGGALSMDLLASLALFQRIELAMHLPLRVLWLPSEPPLSVGGHTLVAGAGRGDLRLIPKLVLFRDDRAGLALALAVPVTLPTGRADHLRSSGGVTVEPRALAMRARGRWSLAGSLGLRLRSAEGDYAPGNELTIGLAGGYTPRVDEELLHLQLELLGGWLPGTQRRVLSNLPLEVLAGFAVQATRGWSFTFAAGAGLSNAVAIPDGRFICGVRYAAFGSEE